MSNYNFEKIEYNGEYYFPRDTHTYLVKGTQSGSTNSWVGPFPDGITSEDIVDGFSIDYFLPYAGTSSPATLNLGNSGPKPVYFRGVNLVTNQFPAYSVLKLTYIVNSNMNSGNGCWEVSGFYWNDTDTKVTQTLTSTSSNYPLLLANTGQTATTTGTSYFGTKFQANPSTGNLSATKFNNITLTSNSTGFSVSGGTTSKTLTVTKDYTLGDASEKAVDTSISAGSTSANLPTSQAVASFMSGYVSTDEKVKLTSTSTSGNYPIVLGPTSITSGNDYTANYNTGVSVNPNTKAITATSFIGNLTGTASGNLTSSSTLNATKLSGAVPASSLSNITTSKSGSGRVVTNLSASNGTITYTTGSGGFTALTDNQSPSKSITLDNNGENLYFNGTNGVNVAVNNTGTGGVNFSLSKSYILDMFYPVGSYYETSDILFNPNSSWGGTWTLEDAGRVHIGAGSGYFVVANPINADIATYYEFINDAYVLTSDTAVISGKTYYSLNTFTAGLTGGEIEHLLTSSESGLQAHTHTQAQHRHTLATDWSSGSGSKEAYTMANNRATGAVRYTSYVTPAINANTAQNATNAHNNMQPYVVVNRWHRTA